MGPSLAPVCTGAAAVVVPGSVAPQESPHAAVHNLWGSDDLEVEALRHFSFPPDCEPRNGEGKVLRSSLKC